MSLRERFESSKRLFQRGPKLPPISRDYLEAHRGETETAHDALIAGAIVNRLETKVTNLITGRSPVLPIDLVRIIEDVGQLDAMGVTQDPKALTEIRKIGALPEISTSFKDQLDAAKAATESASVIRLIRAGVVLGYADIPSQDRDFKKLVEDHTALIEESKKPTPEWRDAKDKMQQKWDVVARDRSLPTGPRPHELLSRYTAAMDILHEGILDPTTPITELELIAGLEVATSRVWYDETGKISSEDMVSRFFKRYATSNPSKPQPAKISDLPEAVKIMFVPAHLRSTPNLSRDEAKLIRTTIRTKYQRAVHPDTTNSNMRNFDPDLQKAREELTKHILAAGTTAGSLRGSRS